MRAVKASLEWAPVDGAPALPASIRTHRMCEHSMADELVALVGEALELGAENVADQLSKLHLLPEGLAAQTSLGRHDAFSKRWTTALDRFKNPCFRAKVDECIRRFVKTHVADALDASAHGWHDFVYQAEPSLRVHMPNTRPGIQKHKDFDYYHQPTEMNFWIPLVPQVWGSNSLYFESAPGRGDFSAVEAELGQFLRFWGNQCEHYTTCNETDVTRVSMDLRVVPLALFDPDFASPKGTVPFKIGQYYATTAPEDGATAGGGSATAPEADATEDEP